MSILQFFVLILFIWYLPGNLVRSDNPIYKCVATGDPHLYTWEYQGQGLSHNGIYQDCYRIGYYPLIKNEYFHLKIKVEGLIMTNFELYFFDGISKTPFCFISSICSNVIVHNSEQCQRNGIEWDINRYGNYAVTRINYAKASFHTILTATEYGPGCESYYIIEAFLPRSIASNSTGICTFRDPHCLLNERAVQIRRSTENDTPTLRTITPNEAQAACQIHIDAFLSKTHRSASARSEQLNQTIATMLADCETDVILTGNLEVANGAVNTLLIEDLISGLDSIDAIQTAVNTGIQNGLVMMDQAAEVAQARISQLFDPTTTVAVDATTTDVVDTTTTIGPLISVACNIFQNVYVQTWHTQDQVLPPSRSCFGQATSFHLIKNNYTEYILETDGSVIEQLTLILFDESSTEICNVWMTQSTIGWSSCTQNGIKPTLIRSGTHETLTINYSAGHFTTTVTRDLGVFVGRFVIESSLPLDTATHSAGICNLLSYCAA